MSFADRQLSLPNSFRKELHKFKLCGKCQKEKPPEGGTELGPGRWICASCWSRRAIQRSKQ